MGNFASRRIAGCCALASVCMLTVLPATAQTPVFPNTAWTVEPAFADNSGARLNISGVACALPPSRACIAVNDAAPFVQGFTISGTTIRPIPAAIIGLTSTPGLKTARGEGAARDNQFFYVVTSRTKDATGQADTSFLIARFGTDSTGRPPAPGGATGLQISEKIRDALAAGIPIPQIAGQQLTRDNAQLQGIAVKDGIIHLGFRTPVVSGKAFIVSAPVAQVFGTGTPTLTVRPLALGPALGIHDLATASDGILVLAGPALDLSGPASLFHFNDTTGQVHPVAQFAQPVDRSAEGLLLLEEFDEFYHVLLMFDGVADGGPIDYGIAR